PERLPLAFARRAGRCARLHRQAGHPPAPRLSPATGHFRRSTTSVPGPSVVGMTTNAIQSLAIANTFVFTNDTEASLGFYRDVLGFKVHTDVSNGDFRWVTLTTPTQPDIEIVIHNYTGGGAMPMADSDAEHLHDLLAKGLLAAL